MLDALAKGGVAFVALKENIRVEGKRDIQTKVMTTLFASKSAAAAPTPNPAAIAVRGAGFGRVAPQDRADRIRLQRGDRDANSPCVQPRRSRCARIPRLLHAVLTAVRSSVK